MQGVVAFVRDADGAPLVIKMLNTENGSLSQSAQEMVYLQHLGDHPHIVGLVPDVCCVYDSHLFLAQEAILGDDLNRMIESGKEFSTQHIEQWTVQILQAVAYMHAKDCVETCVD